MKRLVLVLSCLTLFASAIASADLPAPPGQRRVGYTFRLTGDVPEGVKLLAFPAYFDGSNTPELVPAKEYMLVQGYQPSIWAVPAAKAGEAPKSGRIDETTAWLDANGKKCIDKVPRVYQVAESTGVMRVLDELHIDKASATDCAISPVKATYDLDGGKKVEHAFRGTERVMPNATATVDASAPPPAASRPKTGCGCRAAGLR